MTLRIFIRFAQEDIRYRDLLVGQAKNNMTPFELVDMSLQKPFDSKWKTRCREKIKRSHAFIVLLSKKTWRADGARWEIKCAAEEGISCLGIHVRKDDKGAIPPELCGRVIHWRWDSIARFINEIDGKRSFWDRILS